MHFNILTIFPDLFPGTLSAGVVGRALEKKIWSYDVINIRDFAINSYGSVDDTQFGGGAGMVMRPDGLHERAAIATAMRRKNFFIIILYLSCSLRSGQGPQAMERETGSLSPPISFSSMESNLES